MALGLSDLSGSLGQATVCVSPHARGDGFGWLTRHRPEGRRHVTGASCESEAARLQGPRRQVSRTATRSNHSSLSGEVRGRFAGQSVKFVDRNVCCQREAECDNHTLPRTTALARAALSQLWAKQPNLNVAQLPDEWSAARGAQDPASALTAKCTWMDGSWSVWSQRSLPTSANSVPSQPESPQVHKGAEREREMRRGGGRQGNQAPQGPQDSGDQQHCNSGQAVTSTL